MSISKGRKTVSDIYISSVEELTHWGVKGMRWGVRTSPDGVKSGKPKAKAPKESGDYKRASKLKTKKISEMTNKELGDLNKRLQLEKSYAELTRKPSKFEKFKKVTNNILWVANVANQGVSIAKGPLGQAGRALFEAGWDKYQDQYGYPQLPPGPSANKDK